MYDFLIINAEIIQIFGTLAIALASITSALMAGFLIRENKRLRKAGSSPKVVAYLQFEEPLSGVFNIAIKNIGNGPAIDVEISVDIADEQRKKYPILLNNYKDHLLCGLLPQGEQIRTCLGNYSLSDGDGLSPFSITTKFKSLNGETSTEISNINIKGFSGFGPGIPEGNHLIHKHLKSIATSLKSKH